MCQLERACAQAEALWVVAQPQCAYRPKFALWTLISNPENGIEMVRFAEAKISLPGMMLVRKRYTLMSRDIFTCVNLVPEYATCVICS